MYVGVCVHVCLEGKFFSIRILRIRFVCILNLHAKVLQGGGGGGGDVTRDILHFYFDDYHRHHFHYHHLSWIPVVPMVSDYI